MLIHKWNKIINFLYNVIDDVNNQFKIWWHVRIVKTSNVI